MSRIIIARIHFWFEIEIYNGKGLAGKAQGTNSGKFCFPSLSVYLPVVWQRVVLLQSLRVNKSGTTLFLLIPLKVWWVSFWRLLQITHKILREMISRNKSLKRLPLVIAMISSFGRRSFCHSSEWFNESGVGFHSAKVKDSLVSLVIARWKQKPSKRPTTRQDKQFSESFKDLIMTGETVTAQRHKRVDVKISSIIEMRPRHLAWTIKWLIENKNLL